MLRLFQAWDVTPGHDAEATEATFSAISAQPCLSVVILSGFEATQKDVFIIDWARDVQWEERVAEG